MKFNTALIRSLCRDLITYDLVQGNVDYEWIDIVGIPPRPEISKKVRLYFASYSMPDGWTAQFDRRPQAVEIARQQGWHIISDEKPSLVSVPVIYVVSLPLVARRLYDYARLLYFPLIIGVTGSVGKTSIVSFIETLLMNNNCNVLRFYSKRLTPMSVMCHFINRVDATTEVIAIEYSAYRMNHIATLAELLPPSIAFITNIYNTHISVDLFPDQTSILQSKLMIRTNQTRCSFINNDIIRLGLIKPSDVSDWKIFNTQEPPCEYRNMPPTKRTSELYTVGVLVADQLGFPMHIVAESLRDFVPSEQRILPIKIAGKRIFFHGETSGGSRLWSWFETNDKSVPFLFVEEIDFGDEDSLGFKSLLENIFSKQTTLVYDTPVNRSRLVVPAQFVSWDDFTSKLRHATGYIVYHKALATRRKDFVPTAYIWQILKTD